MVQSRCKGAEVVLNWWRGASAKVQRWQWQGAQRSRGVEFRGERCRGADEVQRCRGAEVQRCRDADMKVLRCLCGTEVVQRW